MLGVFASGYFVTLLNISCTDDKYILHQSIKCPKYDEVMISNHELYSDNGEFTHRI